ncbi:MAG: DUF4783 domain-containing protein [Paludibacter sp.]|nr:DUF4783 domain-containing protein [Paludibacter sp.]
MKMLISVILMICSIQIANAQHEVSADILNAISEGNAVVLSSYFNENVELVVGSANDVFSKQQAVGIMTDFFKKNKVSSFHVLHKGTKESSAFSICTLKTTTNTFRVYVLVRRSGTGQLIQQLRIESSND